MKNRIINIIAKHKLPKKVIAILVAIISTLSLDGKLFILQNRKS